MRRCLKVVIRLHHLSEKFTVELPDDQIDTIYRYGIHVTGICMLRGHGCPGGVIINNLLMHVL